MRERGLKLKIFQRSIHTLRVVPRAGTWLETCLVLTSTILSVVVPRAGAGRETNEVERYKEHIRSFPVRERGLKLLFRKRIPDLTVVVPRAGTWIEIRQPPAHPSNTGVVPRVGTWIEICTDLSPIGSLSGRSPCGNVD